MTTTVSAADLPFDEAIDFLRAKTNVTSESYRDVWGRANVKSFTVAGATSEALVDDFRREVAGALERGSSLQEFRKGFDAIVEKHGWAHTGKPGWRSQIIFETNLGTAYAAGRYKQQTEPETLAAFPYWQYVHSGARHPRREHLSWNGLTLRADDPWWDTHYPPNGWRCGCRTRPVSARGLQRMGKGGPDSAPQIELREHVDRATGEVRTVPKGIDPGWDYNVGRAWAGPAYVPRNATLSPPSLVTPAETVPPAPRAKPPRTAPTSDADLYTVPPERPRPGAAGPSSVVESWARRVLEGEINDRAASIAAARLPDRLMRALDTAEELVEVSAFRVLKVAGRAQEMGGAVSSAHPEVTARDWAQLQRLVDGGSAWRDPAKAGGHLQVTLIGEIDGRRMMAVLRRVPSPGGGRRVIVPTLHEVGQRRMARLTRRLERIDGEE